MSVNPGSNSNPNHAYEVFQIRVYNNYRGFPVQMLTVTSADIAVRVDV